MMALRCATRRSLTPAACEGTTTLFEVDYFGDEKAYLTQSGQLYNEATAAAFGKVYCLVRHFAQAGATNLSKGRRRSLVVKLADLALDRPFIPK